VEGRHADYLRLRYVQQGEQQLAVARVDDGLGALLFNEPP
jgi:hypothetical protein